MTANPDKRRAMLAKARNKLGASRLLFEYGQYDDVASRSYFAIFHAMNAALASRKLSFSSHVQTIVAFNREFVKPGIFPKRFSEMIQGLFEDMQLADYDFDSVIDEQTAQESLENAETIIEEIERFLSVS